MPNIRHDFEQITMYIVYFSLDGKSALQFIIDNETDGHLAMLDNPVVNQLIEQKWHAYGQVSEDLTIL